MMVHDDQDSGRNVKEAGKEMHLESESPTEHVRLVKKRDGRLMPFNERKIANAIFRAAQAVGGEDRALSAELANVVTLWLERNYEDRTPAIEEIQDVVEKVLIETGHAKTAKAYILYRDRRARIREALKVRKKNGHSTNTTDLALLVDAGSLEEVRPWNKRKISLALQKEADITADLADEIAGAVEQRVFASGLKRIATGLIRELVDNELFERGLTARLEQQSIIGMPLYDLDMLIKSKSNENSNISQNNP